MFKFRRKVHEPSKLDDLCNEIYSQLAGHTIDEEAFGYGVSYIEKLEKIRHTSDDSRVNPNTLVAGAVNLLGIVMILQHERVHVVATKALGFVAKMRS